MKTIINEVKMLVDKFDKMRVKDFLQNPERFKLIMLITMLDDPARKQLRRWLFDLHKTELVDCDGQPLPVDLVTDIVGLSRKSRFSTINGALTVQRQTIVRLGVAYYFSPIQLWVLCLLCFILFESTEDKVILTSLDAGIYELNDIEFILLNSIKKPSYHVEAPEEDELDNRHRPPKEDPDTRHL